MAAAAAASVRARVIHGGAARPLARPSPTASTGSCARVSAQVRSCSRLEARPGGDAGTMRRQRTSPPGSQYRAADVAPWLHRAQGIDIGECCPTGRPPESPECPWRCHPCSSLACMGAGLSLRRFDILSRAELPRACTALGRRWCAYIPPRRRSSRRSRRQAARPRGRISQVQRCHSLVRREPVSVNYSLQMLCKFAPRALACVRGHGPRAALLNVSIT